MRSATPILLVVLTASCATPGSAARKKFAEAYDCSSVRVGRLGGDRYSARGCGRSVTYHCTKSGNYGRYSCSSAAPREKHAARDANTRASAKRSSRQSANVERIYDSERDVRAVRATFQPNRSVSIVFAGAPDVELGTILIKVTRRPSYQDEECKTLKLAINAIPIEPDRYESRRTPNGQYQARAHFEFEAFKPLAGNLPTFGIEGCRERWEFNSNGIEALRSFFLIYSELAKETEREPAEEETDEVDAPIIEL